MAVDTASKRASACGFASLEEFIIPDGTLDQGDRQTVANCYSGILAEVVTLLVVCFVNFKSVVQDDLNLKSIVASAGNFKSVIQNDMNIRNTLKTDLNIKGEVC